MGKIGIGIAIGIVPKNVLQPLLLDKYTGAVTAYSLRRLSNNFNGNAIRVRRSSDNAEQDIGFVNNVLDTVSLLSFCGSSSGYVTIWYDQSGNGRDASNANIASQPRIVNAGVIDSVNGIPAMTSYGLATTCHLMTSSSFSMSTSFTILGVNYVAPSSNGSTFTCYHGDTGVNGYGIYNTTVKTGILYGGVVENLNGSLAKGALRLYTATRNGTTANFWTNGVQGTLSNPNNSFGNTSSNFLPFRSETNGNMYNFEVIYYQTDKSSQRTEIEDVINNYYKIYWNGASTSLLDSYSSSAVAYSLRSLTKNYKGAIIRVRRSSDNLELDVTADYNGNLDTSALVGFANGANNCFVTTWYDQSGNGKNATQTTAAYQPKIVNLGSVLTKYGKPNITFATQWLNIGTQVLLNAQRAIFTVMNSVSGTSSAGLINYQSASTLDNPEFRIGMGEFVYDYYAGGYAINAGNINAYSGGLVSNTFNGSNLTSYYKNGILMASGTRSGVLGTTVTEFTIGKYNNINFTRDGAMSEMIVYNTDQTTNRVGIETLINNYYQIFWTGASATLLNTYSGASAAYSLRSLSTTFRSAVIRVRRSSDNAEIDIGTTYAGGLDTSGLTTFVGAGNDGFVTTWYDQSGNGKNLTQTTAANQPLVVSAGTIFTENSKTAIKFDGINDYLVNNTTYPLNVNLTIFGKINKITHTDFCGIFSLLPDSTSPNNRDWASANGRAFEMSASGPTVFAVTAHSIFSGSNGFSDPIDIKKTITLNTPFIFSFIESGGNAKLRTNGGTDTTNTYDGTPTNPNGLLIGARYDAGLIQQSGNISASELVFYPTDMSTDRTNIENNLNVYYGTY